MYPVISFHFRAAFFPPQRTLGRHHCSALLRLSPKTLEWPETIFVKSYFLKQNMKLSPSPCLQADSQETPESWCLVTHPAVWKGRKETGGGPKTSPISPPGLCTSDGSWQQKKKKRGNLCRFRMRLHLISLVILTRASPIFCLGLDDMIANSCCHR